MEIGKPFSFAKTNAPLDHLTISEKISPGLTVFSLGRKTSISKESYLSPCLYIGLSGEGTLESETESRLSQGEGYFSEAGEYLGKRGNEGFLYLEVTLKKETHMNEIISKGKAFALKDLLPYQEGKIANLTLMENKTSQLAVLAMSKGTELTPHKAPGEALLLILDGEGIIAYEGVENHVRAGDSFAFAKNGLHAVKAITNFKFALLLEF